MICTGLSWRGSYSILAQQLARAGLVAFDAEHAHQLTLDCLAQRSLAVEHRILELDHADALADHLPAGNPGPIAVIADRAVAVAGGAEPRASPHWVIRLRRGIEQRRDVLEDLAPAVLRRIEPQLDRRRARPRPAPARSPRRRSPVRERHARESAGTASRPGRRTGSRALDPNDAVVADRRFRRRQGLARADGRRHA